MRKSKFPLPQTIYVDVDGTLIFDDGRVNESLVDRLRKYKARGFKLILWSYRGSAHAESASDAAGCRDLFSHILGKPGYIIDDRGWAWTAFTKKLKVIERAANQVDAEESDFSSVSE